MPTLTEPAADAARRAARENARYAPPYWMFGPRTPRQALIQHPRATTPTAQYRAAYPPAQAQAYADWNGRAPGFWCAWRVHCAHRLTKLCMASDLTQLRARSA